MIMFTIHKVFRLKAVHLIFRRLIGLLRTSIHITRVTDLKIGHLNVNSIYGKADEVIDLLNTCRFDIFFVAESKIDGSVNSTLFAHSEYRIIRRDRKKGGGGMLVYIRRSVTAIRRAKPEPDCVESICLDVKGCGNSWFLICACYDAHPVNARYPTSYPRVF